MLDKILILIFSHSKLLDYLDRINISNFPTYSKLRGRCLLKQTLLIEVVEILTKGNFVPVNID